MNPTKLWKRDQVFIEIGVENADTADGLRVWGFENYLGICNTALRAESLDAARPDLEQTFVYTSDQRVVGSNNAQVLLLSGAAIVHLCRHRTVRHVEQIAWRAELSLWALVGMVGWFWNWVSGHYCLPRVATLRRPGAYTQRFFVARLRRPESRGPSSQRYIPHRLGVQGMLRWLQSSDQSYVVLRGSEQLPKIDPVMGLALLVEDKAYYPLLDGLNSAPGIEPCQVHSVQADEMLLPAHLAQQVLDGKNRYRDLCLVPSARDYFHSLAYHAVYRLGTKSRLPVEGSRKQRNPTGDCTCRLTQLAEQQGIGVEISLTGLHRYLMQNQWHPPREELERLAGTRRHAWLAGLLEQPELDIENQQAA